MISRLRKSVRRHRRALTHAAVVIGLIPKFLVPVGYMPTALADGGPLMLCDAYPGLALRGAVPVAADGSQADGAAHNHGAMHADGTGHDPAAHGSHHEQTATNGHTGHGTDPADTDEDRNAHGEWKRCSLGGLASLATIHHDWHVALLPATREYAFVTPAITDTRAARIAFRSRAPPAHA